MSEQLSERVSEQHILSERASEQLNERASEQLSERASEKLSERVSERVSKRVIFTCFLANNPTYHAHR